MAGKEDNRPSLESPDGAVDVPGSDEDDLDDLDGMKAVGCM